MQYELVTKVDKEKIKQAFLNILLNVLMPSKMVVLSMFSEKEKEFYRNNHRGKRMGFPKISRQGFQFVFHN